MKKLLLKAALSMLGSELLDFVYKTYIYPKMEKFVKKTSNTFDDKALKHIDAFFKDMIKDYESKS